jgi:hypothetical protein
MTVIGVHPKDLPYNTCLCDRVQLGDGAEIATAVMRNQPGWADRAAARSTVHEALYIENLKRFAAGEPLLNVVDKEKGY